jgi:hypothetical protein
MQGCIKPAALPQDLADASAVEINELFSMQGLVPLRDREGDRQCRPTADLTLTMLTMRSQYRIGYVRTFVSTARSLCH